MVEEFVYWYKFEEYNPVKNYSFSQRFFVSRKLTDHDIPVIVGRFESCVGNTILNNSPEYLNFNEFQERRKNKYSRIQFISDMEKEKVSLIVKQGVSIFLEDLI